MKKNKKHVKSLYKTINDFMALLKIFMAFVFIGYFFSGMTVVNPDEVALIIRMGKLCGETAAEQIHLPGWVPALPKPFDEVIKVPVMQVREVRVSELAAIKLADDQVASSTIDPVSEGYCISGDENICQAVVLIKYKISDPVKAVLGSSDPIRFFDSIINDLAVSEMTKAAAQFSIDGLLTVDKSDFAVAVKNEIQSKADKMQLGLTILETEIEELAPPNYLKESFEVVNSAFIDRKNFINNAKSIREEKIPRAKSNAYTYISEAQSYYEATLAKAEGEAGRFLKMLKAYNENPVEVRAEMLENTRKTVLKNIKSLVLYPSSENSKAAVKTVINGGQNVRQGGQDYLPQPTFDGYSDEY